MPLQNLKIQGLADELKKMRSNKKYEDEVPKCECELGFGCSCGRFQYDKKWPEREKRLDRNSRNWPLLPKEGQKYLISRPPDTKADYAGINFWYWAHLEGIILRAKQIEQDSKNEGVFWVLFDISKYTKVKFNDWCWIPNDALIEVR